MPVWFSVRSAPSVLALGFALLPAASTHAQDTGYRGRKYKAPPAVSHIEVEVLKGYNGKPVSNAAVIFHEVRDGRDEGNLEVKTNEEGKAVIDVIAIGSAVDVQVIADGFSTFAQQYQIGEAKRDIQVRMVRPQAQISTYADHHGEASTRPAGVQEPNHPSSDPVLQTPRPTNHTSDPNPLAPVDPNATPGNSQNQQTGHPSGGVPPQL